METIEFNGKQLSFDAIYYFSPLGNDITGDGTQYMPFQTPSGAIAKNIFTNNNIRNICFVLNEGIYKNTDVWFNTQQRSIVDNLQLTILSETPELTIIEGALLFQLDHIGGLTTSIDIYNITINWTNITSNGLIDFRTNTLPFTSIKFTNVLLKIGKTIGSYKWFFISGYTQQGQVIFENCIIDCLDNYIRDSINKTPLITRRMTMINSIIHQNLQFDEMNNFIEQNSCLSISNILNSYLKFPLNENISHKGSGGIFNPDDGISHLGVCGGNNAWHFKTYWYKFSYIDDSEISKIPLEQIKQHYKLQHFIPGETLANQIISIEEDINTTGNKVFSYILNSTNTYNIFDFVESPHVLHYTIDENLLGNYNINDIHQVLLEITTPIYTNNQIFIYKNGILLIENIQYEIKNINTVLFYSLNLGDEVYLYIGWENYLNNIHINYKINEDGTTINRIDNIVCENISVKSQYNYDINNRLISQTLLTKDNILQVKEYSYDKTGRLSNIIIR